MEKSPATYDEAIEEMKRLQELAERLKQAEIEAFLAEVKPKIVKYGLTAEQLGFAPKSSMPAKKAPTNTDAPAKYCNKDGKTWSGRGRKPTWLIDAEKAGEDLQQYRVV